MPKPPILTAPGCAHKKSRRSRLQALAADAASLRRPWRAASCRVPGSRLDKREDICTCPAGGQRVEVAVCAKDEKPPPESKALNIARRTAARDGTLVGDTIDGRRICVAPRNP